MAKSKLGALKAQLKPPPLGGSPPVPKSGPLKGFHYVPAAPDDANQVRPFSWGRDLLSARKSRARK